jgi:hypothetical protein
MVLVLGHRKVAKNTWKGVEEGWRSSFGPIVCEMKKYYIESRGKSISYVQLKKNG